MTMRRSRTFIYSTNSKNTLILEAPTPDAGKTAFLYIKDIMPMADIGIFGAKDINTLRRTNRDLKSILLIKDIDVYVKALSEVKNHKVLA